MPSVDELMNQTKAKSREHKAIDLEALAYKELYTLKEVALLLSMSRTSVNNLITVKRRTGLPRLRTVREPNTRLVRVTKQDLMIYVQRLRTEAGIKQNDTNNKTKTNNTH